MPDPQSPHRRRPRKPRPTIRPERDLAARIGSDMVAGLDEAGRGPIAGPVVAAAVVWAPGARRPAGITDSKLLTARTRDALARRIKARCLSWGIGICHAEEIDMINILEATRLAAARAVEDLENRLTGVMGQPTPITALVTDCLEIPTLRLPTISLVKGDQKSASVAAASILAKTTRDAMMDTYAAEFPGYGWESNRGYPTEDHYASLMMHGPTTLHRMTFRGVGFFCESPRHSRTYETLRGRIMGGGDDPASIEVLLAQIDGAADRIPPREVALLREMLEAGLSPEPPERQRP